MRRRPDQGPREAERVVFSTITWRRCGSVQEEELRRIEGVLTADECLGVVDVWIDFAAGQLDSQCGRVWVVAVDDERACMTGEAAVGCVLDGHRNGAARGQRLSAEATDHAEGPRTGLGCAADLEVAVTFVADQDVLRGGLTRCHGSEVHHARVGGDVGLGADDALPCDLDSKLWVVPIVALDDEAGRVGDEVGGSESQWKTQRFGCRHLYDAVFRHCPIQGDGPVGGIDADV